MKQKTKLTFWQGCEFEPTDFEPVGSWFAVRLK